MIPLCVKTKQSVQKFRIPFKNVSSSVDAEMEFYFAKTTIKSKADLEKTDSEEAKQPMNVLDYIEFSC